MLLLTIQLLWQRSLGLSSLPTSRISKMIVVYRLCCWLLVIILIVVKSVVLETVSDMVVTIVVLLMCRVVVTFPQTRCVPATIVATVELDRYQLPIAELNVMTILLQNLRLDQLCDCFLLAMSLPLVVCSVRFRHDALQALRQSLWLHATMLVLVPEISDDRRVDRRCLEVSLDSLLRAWFLVVDLLELLLQLSENVPIHLLQLLVARVCLLRKNMLLLDETAMFFLLAPVHVLLLDLQ